MPRHVADTDGGLGALLDYDKQASRAKSTRTGSPGAFRKVQRLIVREVLMLLSGCS